MIHELRRHDAGLDDDDAHVGRELLAQLDSQLTAADVALDAAILDRIDEVVQPGVNLNPADTSYGEQVLEPALRRR